MFCVTFIQVKKIAKTIEKNNEEIFIENEINEHLLKIKSKETEKKG